MLESITREREREKHEGNARSEIRKKRKTGKRGKRERHSDEEERLGGREEAAGPGPEGLCALLWHCQHSGTRKRERAAGTRGREVGSGGN